MKKQILVIEDDAKTSASISDILQLANYNVIQAPNGKIGVDLAQKKHPDLILCDVLMPELDGYGVAQILKNDETTANIPFIFLTSMVEKHDFRLGMDFGADDYMTKPFNDVDLLKMVDMRLKRGEWLRSAYGMGKYGDSTFFNKERELKEFEELIDNRQLRYYKRKDIIYLQGQVPNCLYYIKEGKIKTYKLNTYGKELITGIHGKGEFLGYLPLLEEMPYSENAEALEQSKVFIIPKSDFLSLIYSSKDAAHSFIKLLSNDLEEMEARLLDVAYSSVRQRIANVLLKICNDPRLSEKSIITMARKDIANMVGTATETLNRVLADFKDEGIVEILEGGLKIINMEKLEHVITH